MCRLMSIWSKKSSSYLMKDWFYAWLKSTKYDHHLNSVYGMSKENCVHKDGWGVVSLGTNNENETDWSQMNFDLRPVFSYKKNSFTRSLMVSPFLKSTNQILLAHARRASINMPITFQQVQPLVINDNKNSSTIYLSHNGKVSSDIVNNLLDNNSQIKSAQLGDFSDTQILSRLIRQKSRKTIRKYKNSVKKFWIPLLQEVIDRHEDESANYQMQLIILEILEHKPQMIACSVLSDNSKRMMPYYGLYTAKRNFFRVICSSTVADYFKSKHKSATWDLEQISNKNLVHLTSEGESYHKFT